MGTKLPRKLEQKMQMVGEQIRFARLRRNLSVAQIAERATCSPLTVVSIRPRACFSPSYNKVKSQTKHVWLLTLL